ncbi:hypothetical protein F480_07920 [Bibersteinia trehalosi Y31]|uniref:Uncharacterized protein n=1 Tax=Bibersteinia trehalosi Y31 TaxID=1261658 RepID=A0A179CZF2_BIBTR|nr:hypothetical protein F480_07920 [Bibersteinia trehalosi Y31]
MQQAVFFWGKFANPQQTVTMLELLHLKKGI